MLTLAEGRDLVRLLINDVAGDAFLDAEIDSIINRNMHLLHEKSGRLTTYSTSVDAASSVAANSLAFDVPSGSSSINFAEILDVFVEVTGGSNPDGPMLEKVPLRDLLASQYENNVAASAPKKWAPEYLTGQTPNGRCRVWFTPKVNATLDFFVIGRRELSDLVNDTDVPEFGEAMAQTLWGMAAVECAVVMGHDQQFVASLAARLPQDIQQHMAVLLRSLRPFHGETPAG